MVERQAPFFGAVFVTVGGAPVSVGVPTGVIMEFRSPEKRAFDRQKSQALSRGLGFELTFEQWCEIWRDSGKWSERGQRGFECCMARRFDVGPYSFENVVIMTNEQNLKDAARFRRDAVEADRF